MEELAKILEEKTEFIEKVLEMLADKELDLELEFEDMKLEVEGFELNLTGKTVLSAKTKNVES